MHYYTKNIADFNNATRHLSRQERSIYSDLIELQYDLETPIPNDLDWICRKVLAFTESERTDVERMLNEFFDSVEQGWSNGRCETEIAAFRDKQAKAIAAGKASGSARRRNKKPAKTTPSNGSERTLNGCSTDVEPTKNQEPLTNNQEPLTKFTREDRSMAEQFYQRILLVAPKHRQPNFDSWADDIRLMREQDGHSLEEIWSVFLFANSDPFWKSNILSTGKLRKQFSTLHARMIAGGTNANSGRGYQSKSERADAAARAAILRSQ